MPSSSNPFNLVSAGLLIFCGVLTGPLGLVGLFAETGTMRAVFGALAVCGAVLIGGGIQAICAWQRAVKEESAHRAALTGAPQAQAPAAPPTPAAGQAADPAVLARWSYTPQEWQAYAAEEYRFRVGEAVWFAVGIMLLGTLVLQLRRPATLALALLISAAFGALFGLIRLLVARTTHAAQTATPTGEVVISPRAILLNGRYHVLEDGRFHFGGVRYLDEETPPVLEFTVRWNTRSGVADEQVYVPVPRGREEEARALVESFPTATARPEPGVLP